MLVLSKPSQYLLYLFSKHLKSNNRLVMNQLERFYHMDSSPETGRFVAPNWAGASPQSGQIVAPNWAMRRPKLGTTERATESIIGLFILSIT